MKTNELKYISSTKKMQEIFDEKYNEFLTAYHIHAEVPFNLFELIYLCNVLNDNKQIIYSLDLILFIITHKPNYSEKVNSMCNTFNKQDHEHQVMMVETFKKWIFEQVPELVNN